MGLEVTVEQMESPDAQRLISALDAHLSERYLPSERFGPNLRPEQTAAGNGLFVLARLDGTAAGCGAVRLLGDGDAEVKRMWVNPELRRQGVARAVLARLEEAAVELGARRLVLETGIHQEEAIRLYRSSGFVPVECWGEYAGVPTSLCMAKPIVRPQPGR